MKLELLKLFLDAERAGNIALRRNRNGTIIWDGGHCVFVGDGCGPLDMKAFIEANAETLRSLGVVKCCYESDKARSAIESAAGDYDVESYGRVIFRGNGVADEGEPSRAMIPADAVVRNGDRYGNARLLEEEIASTWGAVDGFKKGGFGVCALDGAQVIGWCLSEYNSQGKCGIGIETLEDYRRQGVGAAMVAEFMKACRAKGVRPLWDSWIWNMPSVRLAERAGFTRIEEYGACLLSARRGALCISS